MTTVILLCSILAVCSAQLSRNDSKASIQQTVYPSPSSSSYHQPSLSGQWYPGLPNPMNSAQWSASQQFPRNQYPFLGNSTLGNNTLGNSTLGTRIHQYPGQQFPENQNHQEFNPEHLPFFRPSFKKHMPKQPSSMGNFSREHYGNYFQMPMPHMLVPQMPMPHMPMPHMPMSGNPMSMSGNPIPMSGNPMSMSGNPIPMSGNPMSMSENPIPMSGNPIPMSGNPMSSGLSHMFPPFHIYPNAYPPINYNLHDDHHMMGDHDYSGDTNFHHYDGLGDHENHHNCSDYDYLHGGLSGYDSHHNCSDYDYLHDKLSDNDSDQHHNSNDNKGDHLNKDGQLVKSSDDHHLDNHDTDKRPVDIPPLGRRQRVINKLPLS